MSDENENDDPQPDAVNSPDDSSPSKADKSTSTDNSSAANSAGANPPRGESRISRYVSFGLLLAVITLVGILFYEVMAQFLVPLFLAALLVVVFRPLHEVILDKCGGREKLGALLTTAAVLLTVLVPIGILLVMAAAEGRQVYAQFNASQIVEGARQIRTNLNLDMPSGSDLRLIENEFLDLQHNLALTAADEDRQRIGLYEIQESAKSIAEKQGLSWPAGSEVGEDETPQEPKSNWEDFVSNLTAARTMHVDMNWTHDEDKKENELRYEKLHEYQILLNNAADAFSDYRIELLGGKTRAWATELVNPSDKDAEDYAHSVVSYLRDKLFKLGGAGVTYVGGLLLGAAIMIIGLYFFLLDGPKMIEAFKGLSPIDDDHEQELVTEFSRVSRAVVVATLLSALVQGLLAGIGFYFAGLESIFLLTVLSAVLAMVPFVGAAAVWVPCSLYLYFFDHNLPAAIGLAVYGAAVISMADNVIKPYILHGQSNLHPLLALLSVLGGVATLGPIGILIGPMVVAFLQTLLKILQREMTDLDRMSNDSQQA